MSRKRIILSDDEDDEVQVVQNPKKVISLEDEEDQASDGLYFTNEDFANSGKTTQSKQKKIELVDNEDSEDHTKRYKPSSSKDQAFNSSSNQPNTRQSSRRQVLSTKHEKQRIEAERELKRLYKKGLDSVLEEESEEEVDEEEDDEDYPEVDEDEEEEYEESEEERPKKKSKITGKKALDAYNASGYHKQRSNYSNSVVARCLKDYDKEDNRYYSDLDDFIVDDDEEEEEEEIEEVAKPRKPKAKRKSKRVEESDEEENEQQQESDEGSEVIKRKRKKDKKNHKLQLSSEDEDDQKSEEEEEEEDEEEASEEDDEESLDGNLLYFRVNQMRESKEHEIEETGDIAGMLGFRKSYPVPEAMAYYIEYIGKCLISKDAFRDAPKSSPHLAAARQIENLICTNRESLLGSSAWRQDFLKELQHRPFYVHFKTAGHYFNDCNDEKCQACGRGTHRPDHRVSLFGPTYEAMRIWENHWIDLIPKALLLHNSKKNSSSSSGTPKTPSRKTQTSSPATTHSANTPSVSRNPSRGSKQLEIVQSSLQPPNSLTKRRLSLSPITNRSSSLNNSASKSKTTSDQASPSKKRNAIILSDSEDEIQIAEQPVDLTVEDSLMLQKEETRAFPDHVVSTEKDSAEPADEEIRNDQNGDEEDSDHSDSTNTTDTDNDEREKSEKKSKRRFRHKKIEWWEKKLPKELVHEEETTWNLSFHCKNRTQLYHTLLHYKFRLLLKIYEYFDKVNGANCELSELTLEELQRLYNTMINDHSFIHEEANRFQSLIRTAGNRWGGDKYEAQMDIWRNDNQIFERRERILGDKKGSKSKRKHDEVENVDDKKTNYQPESEHETKKQRGGQKRVLSFNTTRQPKHQSSMMDWFATSSK